MADKGKTSNGGREHEMGPEEMKRANGSELRIIRLIGCNCEKQVI